jgi:uncharacterized protein YprB with RNaseH-like and TPR domain
LPERQGEATPEQLRRERIQRLRSLMGGVVARQGARRLAPPAAPLALPGETRDTAHGPLHVIAQYLEPRHCHGATPIAGALEVPAASIAELALDETLGGIEPRKMLLLDTETTGLAGGTGTLPFLVGLAWFEDESLRVEQLFLRRPGEEVPILRALAERLADASVLVTYNGKSFDWPLLRTRFVMSRVAMPEPPPHLDLLHCARRIYKRRLAGMRLVHVEREVLGMHREHDVDGAEIPGIYLAYLRGELDPRMHRVIEHNANDLVALAALLARAGSGMEAPSDADAPEDLLGYALVCERARDAERAERFARAAARAGGPPSCSALAGLLTARLARRRRDPDVEERALLDAAHVLDAMTDAPLAARVHHALAKHYEHRRKDPARALTHAHLAAAAEPPDAHTRRLARLTSRLANTV